MKYKTIEDLNDTDFKRLTDVQQETFEEILGALGMILPMATGILPWFTPVAAVGLSLIQLLAIFSEYLPREEYNVLPINAIMLALSAFVVFGRWVLFP